MGVKDGGIRGGVPREIIIEGVGEVDPAEGANLTYKPSGRGGPVKVSGNNVLYGESNPHPGTINQDITVDAATFKKLVAAQAAGKFLGVTITTAGDDILDCKLKFNTDGGLENNNGVVTLDMAGEVRIR